MSITGHWKGRGLWVPSRERAGTLVRSFASIVSFSCLLVVVGAAPASAGLYRLAAAGTISFNSSSDSTIAAGTPWAFELTYDTAAPDLDFELTGMPDATFGRFTNTAEPPALTFFHYKAGSYEVTLDDPADFGQFSNMLVTFTSIHGIDINIFAPDLFPPLAGGPVSFHADFAKFTPPTIFASDALPTNTALGPGSFDDSNVTLLPPAGAISGSGLTSLTLTAVLPGDYNENGVVDAADYTVWRNHLGAPAGTLSNDVDGGTISQAQYNTWKANFGSTGTLGSAGSEIPAVPEPATAALVVVEGLMVVVGRVRPTLTFDCKLQNGNCRMRRGTVEM
jgi:hypothetical protein